MKIIKSQATLKISNLSPTFNPIIFQAIITPLVDLVKMVNLIKSLDLHFTKVFFSPLPTFCRVSDSFIHTDEK